MWSNAGLQVMHVAKLHLNNIYKVNFKIKPRFYQI